VRIEKLGAHLEAYTNTLPVITALRLCNRFGKGTNCYISKLPTELIDAIEHLVLEPERERCLVSWSKELKCWKRDCNMFEDHFTPEEQEIFCAHHLCMTNGCEDEAHTTGGEKDPHGHICLGRGTCGLAHSLSYEEALISMPKKLSEETYVHECSDSRMKFQRKVEDGFLYNHRHLLKLHFNVDFWTSTSRAWVSGWGPVALAYLTIPSDSAQRYPKPNLPAGYNTDGRVLQPGGSLSPVSHKRFSDALRRLDLELFIHYGGSYGQERDIEFSRQTMSSAAVDEAGPWPRLIKMARDASSPDVFGRS
jgi:hypothetical protein